MSGKEGSRIFVGGLSPEVVERDLERAFNRFGDILDCQIMLERDTGRSRGFGFITFADRRAMDESIREMHGRDFGDRVISVNRAEPKSSRDDSESHGSRGGRDGGYSFAAKGSFGGGVGGRVAEDECFKCGRVGHWARDCPSASNGRGGPVGGFSSRGAAFGGSDGRVDRYAERERYVDRERERYVDDRYDGAARFGARDRFESREAYIPRDRYTSDRYAAPADRFAGGDRYSRGSDRYPPASYDKARSFERDVVPSAGGDRYGGGRVGGPIRGGEEGRGFRSRAGGPYERPSRGSGGGGYPSSSTFDRY